MAHAVIKSIMEETGMSIMDVLAATIEVAHHEFASDLERGRDQIIEGLYGHVECLDCITHVECLEKYVIADTGAHLVDMKTHGSTRDQGMANITNQSNVAAKEKPHQDQQPQRRPLRVKIRLRKEKNTLAEITNTPKSESCKTKGTEPSIISSHAKEQFQEVLTKKENVTPKRFENAKRKLQENEVLTKKEDATLKSFENAKRKLKENYEKVAQVKRQRSIKMLSVSELPEQETNRIWHKTLPHAPLRARSRILGKLDKFRMRK